MKNVHSQKINLENANNLKLKNIEDIKDRDDVLVDKLTDIFC